MDRLKAIDTFILAARLRSFSAAGRHLRLSRAMVSRHISDLEQHLGVRLFNRTTRETSLTPVGEHYLDVCTRVVDQLTLEEANIASLQKEIRGVLRIVSVRSFGERHLAAAIADFALEHRDLSIEMELAPGTKTSVQLHENGFDVGVCIAPARSLASVTRRVAPFDWIVCASPDYVAASPPLESHEDLLAHRALVNLRHTPHASWRLNRDGRPVQARLNVAVAITNYWSLREVALRGAGIAILPSFCIGEDIASGALVRVLPAYSLKRGEVTAIYPHFEHVPHKVRIFTNFIRRRFAGAFV